MTNKKSDAVIAQTVRLNVRLPTDLREQINYWAKKNKVSANQFIVECVQDSIARANRDYDLPTLEQARLTQLVDGFASLTSSVENMQQLLVSLADTMITLTRGGSYLLDDEGENA